MKEKGIRYSSLGLSLLIIFSILISNIFSIAKPLVNNYFIEDESLKYDLYYELMSDYFVDLDDFYHNGNYFINNENSPIKYYSIRKVISNYQETERYIKANPNTVIYKNKTNPGLFFEIDKNDEGYLHNEYYDQYGSNVKLEYKLISDGNGPLKEVYQKPKYEDILYTNNDDLNFLEKDFNLAKDKLSEELYFTIDINSKSSNVNIVNEEKLSKDTKKFTDLVIDRTLSAKNNSKLVEVKSLILLTDNGKKLEKTIQEKIDIYKKNINMATFVVPIILMFFIIALATGFKKSKNVKFYQVLQSIPIEFVIFGLFLLAVCLEAYSAFVSNSAWNKLYSLFNIDININVFLSLVLSFTLAGAILFILYFINALKSFYHEGFKSFFIQNSIIFRLSRGVYRIFKNIFTKIYRTIVGNNLTNRRRRLISFILIWIIGSAAFGFHPYVVIMSFLFLAGIYYLLSRILSDVQNIEEATYEINKGNFNINLNEDDTYFGNISKNLNNINTSLTNAMNKELKSERMKTELITNLSHDLKTPLTAIINYSDLAADVSLSDEERKKYLDIVNEKSLKLKTLIERLFEVSKVTSRNVTFNYMDIDLNQMITQMIGEWHEDFSRKGIEVVFNSQKESTICKLDGEQTSRILDNMFSNINKYAQENTRVYIDLLQNEQTQLVVKNVSKYSLNITPDELKERFTRGDESRNTEGSGLGLAIASSLTELQGGKFDIEIDGDLFKTIITFNK